MRSLTFSIEKGPNDENLIYFQIKHNFSKGAKSYKSMFYYFLRDYEGDEEFFLVLILIKKV